MQRTCWHGGPDGRYWIDVSLGHQRTRVMVDLGLVDPLGRIGFEVEPGLYGRLKAAGQLTRLLRRQHRDASGLLRWRESGASTAQLVDPNSGQPIGPAVGLYVSEGAPRVPNRVGVVFFHLLHGCRTAWEFDQRLWCIEYP
jgi:hypothetical protein